MVKRFSVLLIITTVLSTSGFSQSQEKINSEINKLVAGYQNYINGKTSKYSFLRHKEVSIRKPFRDSTSEAYFRLPALKKLYHNLYPDGYELKFYDKKKTISELGINRDLNTYFSEVRVPQIVEYFELQKTYQSITKKDSTLNGDEYVFTEKQESLLVIDTLKRTHKSILRLYVTCEYKFQEYEKFKIEAVTFNKFNYKHIAPTGLTKYWVGLSQPWRELIKKKLRFPDVPSEYYLARVSGITSLDLSKSEITDFSPLLQFTGLQKLIVNNRPLDTLSHLRKCNKLIQLEVSNCGLTSLEGIQEMKSLESLSAAKNEIENLMPIRGMINISYLNLNENKIIDISPLRNMTSMRKLYLDLNLIESIEPLSRMVILSELFIKKNKEISSLEPIRKCATLYKLDCFNTKISSLDPIKKHLRMVHLDCSHTQVTSLDPLKNMKGLIHLSFAANKLTDYSILNRLDRLKYLNCSQTNISDISSVSRMEYLKELYAPHTDFSKADIQRFKKKHPKVAITYY